MGPFPSTRVTALILAGGRSTRMGTDKARLCWQGIPLLTRVATAAAQCCTSVAVLTPWPERYSDLVPPPTQWLIEEQPYQGPLVALAQGLKQVPRTWVLLLACDLPCLNPRVLQHWIQAIAAVPPPAQRGSSSPLPGSSYLDSTSNLNPPPVWAYVPRRPQGWEPLCALYHPCSSQALQTFIAQGGRSFQQWLAHIPVQPLDLTPPAAAMLWNCNTPQDWQHPPQP